ncbi:MAG: lactate racemase domain-containing protein [Bryobacteraceae bacterium]
MKHHLPAMPLPHSVLPDMARVRQNLAVNHIRDVRTDVRDKISGSGLISSVKKGHRVAITAGSRGIGGFVDILSGIVDALRAMEAEPFIIPAMGSHGGATPEGQAEILRRLGVDEPSVGVRIRPTMETQDLGKSGSGATAHIDRLAAEADGIIVMGRTKTHPESAGELASGLLKMCTIGLGKQTGAHQAHSHGLWESVRAVPKLQLAKSKILCGVAVVENGYRQPCVIEVVPPRYEAFLEADMRLLRIAKQHLAQIPFDHLDLLIVDELGKTISGAGMDPNVIGHWRNSDGPHTPDFKRIVVLSLTHGSLGNGLGIGMADFTTRRFADAYDPIVSYINLLTAMEPGSNTREGPLPLALESDRDAAEVALFSALPGASPRVCRVRNTAALDELWVSEALLEESQRSSNLSVVERPVPLPYNEAGNLF